MKLGIVTAFPPSKVTLNEYAYHLVKHFVEKPEIEEIILYTDKTVLIKHLDFNYSNKVSVVDCWEFNNYNNVISIFKAVKRTKPDTVLFNLQFMKFGDKKIPAALGLFLPKLIRMAGIPTTVLIHNILETVDLKSAGFANNKLLKMAYNLIGTGLTKLILSANNVAVTIPQYVSILEKKYNAKNVSLIPHGTFEIPERPSYRIPKGPKKIMTFGKFGTYKKVEILIEAVQRVRKSTKEDLEIVIAGTDNPNTIGYLEQVQEKYKHVQGLTFTGYVEEEDVPRIFRESTAVVFPYTSTTGSSGVLHQAGSYGKAVVLPNLGDLAELIKDEGYQGEFFNPESVESLAFAIEKIVLNDVYRIELGKINYKAATAYPMSLITEMYLNIFKKQLQLENTTLFA